MNTPSVSGSRRRRALLGVSLGIVALLLVTSISPEISARAESGRRLCEYIDSVPTYTRVKSTTQVGAYHTIPVNLYVAIDYKKDGACPELPDPYLVAGDTSKPVRISYEQPVPKRTCEDWFREIGVTRDYAGTITESDPPLNLDTSRPTRTDVCTAMTDDVVYEFYVSSTDRLFADGSSYLQGSFVTNERWNAGLLRGRG